MLKKILIVLFLIVAQNCYSQSLFRIIARPKIKIHKAFEAQRVTIIHQQQIERAIQVAEFNSRFRQTTTVNITPMISNNQPVGFLCNNITQDICKPEQLYGSYNYLKLASREMPRLTVNWSHINKTSTYNGAHHIINIAVIQELQLSVKTDYKNLAEYPSLQEMTRQAPALFHPMHNNPKYTSVFHNKERQINLYNECGIKGVIEDFFEQLKIVNEQEGLPELPEDVIIGTLLEAQLWAEHFGLKWDNESESIINNELAE